MEVEERRGGSNFGALLRRHRLAAGLSQEALAERARLSSDGISALERGHRRTPQCETVALLVSALALSAEQCREFEAAAARPSLPCRGVLAVGPWADDGSAGLPFSLTSFVGREAEVAEIAALVRAHRLVTITGAGGVGKTQTALRAAAESCDMNDGTVCFASFAPIEDPSLVATVIANALGVREHSNLPLLDTLVAFLWNKTMLLVLDNCEHVVAEAARVVDFLLRGCPQLRILATSREPLRSGGEYTYRLPSLDDAKAIALFADRAQAVDAHFVLNDGDLPILSDICCRLGGIPLAIELAAARVSSLSLRSLAAALEDHFEVLTSGERTAPPRQQTMRAAIDWSYALLTASEQRVFDQLSIFAGGWTLDFARTVCSGEDCTGLEMLNILSSLVDKSLIVPHLDWREPRYSLLETLRQFGREKLKKRTELDKTARRHALTYLDFAQRVREAQHQGQPYSDDDVLVELNNWRAAIEWTLTARKDVALGQRLVALLGPAWVRFAIAEGHQKVRMALAFGGEEAAPDTMALLMMTAANISYELNEVATALDLATKALALSRLANDPIGIARAQSFIGQCLIFMGRREEAENLLATAMEAATTLDRQWLRAGIHQTIAWSRAMSGNISEARLHYREALLTYKRLNGTSAAAGVLLNLAEAEFLAGNAAAALQLALQALELFRAQNNEYSISMILGNISAYLLAAENWDEARTYANNALILAQQLNLDLHTAWALQHLAGIIALSASGPGSAEKYAQAARILGFVTARYVALGVVQSPTEAGEYRRILAKLKESLEPNLLIALMNEGERLSQSEVIGLI